MSYTLARLELATVCREFADETAADHFQGLEVSYSKILQLDQKIHSTYQRLPEFFLFNPSTRASFNELYTRRPALAWQRCLIQQGYHSRLCRLHRQYFIRGAREPQFAYSHVICLQSARKVIQIKRSMDDEDPAFRPDSSAVWSIVHHVFMAAVILLMDVCFNWDDILGERRRAEALDACRLLSKAQQNSSVVREGVGAMMDILRRHWCRDTNKEDSGPGEDRTAVVGGPPEAETGGSGNLFAADVTPLPDSININTVPNAEDRRLEDIWSELLDQGGTFVSEPPQMEWMDLLAELTNVAGPSSN